MPGQAVVVYGRRRGVALLASLSVVAILSWAGAWIAGSLDRPAGRPDHPAAVSSPGGRAGLSARHTSVTRLGIPAATGATRAALLACPAKDVVLTMHASAPSYSPRQLPEFDVAVVSTAGYPCRFDIGAGHLVLQISAGAAEIWTSADCAESEAVNLLTLSPRVPAVVPMTWNDQYSSAGCPMPGRAAPAGSYTATATAGSAARSMVTFRIG